MSFGLANLSAPKKARKSFGATYDCGKHGKLTVSAIAKIAGITTVSVRFRIKQGVKGAALCAPYRSNDTRKSDAPCILPSVAIAVRLAQAFPGRVPTTKEIQAVRPMSRSSASRWRQAFRDVLERMEDAA